jgi:asparagine synthase (glutamine-hydrolysing)
MVAFENMRDCLGHRGPDGAGLWYHENLALAHRRLAVRDTSKAGLQPMFTRDGRFSVIYNGELYNDAELRAELARLAAVPDGFQTTCDTETVLLAFAAWGPRAFERLRGMFAVAIYDHREHILHMARDPLGIKPLYYHLGAHEVTFASDTRALLAHPGIEALPNLPMASAYLTTLQSTLGRHTLFHELWALEPGQRASFDATNGKFALQQFYRPQPVDALPIQPEEAAERVHEVLADSIDQHLCADVPVAALLSGGIDSTIICRQTSEHTSDLHTWCAGAAGGEERPGDFEFARQVAQEIGSHHEEVRIDKGRFLHDWQKLVSRGGVPLSTPNEIAIQAVARDVQSIGYKVILSGEGADELFGGYELSLQAASDFCATPADKRSAGRFQLDAAAWVAPHQKPHLLSADAWTGACSDQFLFDHFDETFAECQQEVGPAGTDLDAHLRFVRKHNLSGLLTRLDRSTMVASVEGRTPFADERVAAVADSLPMAIKWNGRGKAVLRDAWQDQIPPAIMARKKSSFPLPFQSWMEGLGWRLETSPFARSFFADDLRQKVAANPGELWQLAWPMLNLSLWGDAWWS